MAEQPQNVVQATGAVAGEVVSGLRQQPMLLALVVLVVIGVVFNYWFVHGLIERGHERTMFLFEKCLGVRDIPRQDRMGLKDQARVINQERK